MAFSFAPIVFILKGIMGLFYKHVYTCNFFHVSFIVIAWPTLTLETKCKMKILLLITVDGQLLIYKIQLMR